MFSIAFNYPLNYRIVPDFILNGHSVFILLGQEQSVHPLLIQ